MTFEIPLAGWIFAACFIVFIGEMGFYWGHVEDTEHQAKDKSS
jgi:hypothetical protein